MGMVEVVRLIVPGVTVPPVRLAGDVPEGLCLNGSMFRWRLTMCLFAMEVEEAPPKGFPFRFGVQVR